MVCFLNNIYSILYERGLTCGAVYSLVYFYFTVIARSGFLLSAVAILRLPILDLQNYHRTTTTQEDKALK